jgi:CspA family cold shock protein
MQTGIIKFYNESKGYCFIVDDENQKEVFFHVSGLADDIRQNDKVTFEVRDGKKGENAFNVKKI